MTPSTKKFDRNNSSALRELLSRYRFLYQTSQTSGPGAAPRVPHPGDVLFWVCGVGAMGALLFVTMR